MYVHEPTPAKEIHMVTLRHQDTIYLNIERNAAHHAEKTERDTYSQARDPQLPQHNSTSSPCCAKHFASTIPCAVPARSKYRDYARAMVGF
jgi:hypothetical protein